MYGLDGMALLRGELSPEEQIAQLAVIARARRFEQEVRFRDLAVQVVNTYGEAVRKG